MDNQVKSIEFISVKDDLTVFNTIGINCANYQKVVTYRNEDIYEKANRTLLRFMIQSMFGFFIALVLLLVTNDADIFPVVVVVSYIISLILLVYNYISYHFDVFKYERSHHIPEGKEGIAMKNAILLLGLFLYVTTTSADLYSSIINDIQISMLAKSVLGSDLEINTNIIQHFISIGDPGYKLQVLGNVIKESYLTAIIVISIESFGLYYNANKVARTFGDVVKK